MAVPRGALHLSKKRGGNFLGGILKGAGGLLGIAAGIAPMALGGFGGVSGLVSGGLPLTAVSGLAGGPNALAALNGMQQGRMNAAAMAAMRKRMAARQGLDDDDLSMDDEMGYMSEFENAPAANSPGAMVFRVTCTGHNEVGGVGQIYWMQDETVQDGGKATKRSVAWVDPILLAKQGEAAPSRIVRGYFAFQGASIDPAIVEIGKTVTVSVKLPLPEEPKVHVVVVARNAKTGAMWQLSPGEAGVYRAEIPIDDKFAKNDQTISILAYASGGESDGRSKKAEDAISGAGMWKLEKAFEYNPRIVASRNRLDLRLTVVQTSKQSER